jgi:hypothetical protein
MKPFRDDAEVIAALREMRPAIEPEFAAGLDERAAERFPRDTRLAVPTWSRLRERLATTPPRRLVARSGAVAAVGIVIATAAVITSETGSPTSPSNPGPLLGSGVAGTHPAPHPVTPVPSESAAGPSSSAVGESAGRASENDSAAAQFNAIQPARTGPLASRVAHRDVERGASIVLGDEPAHVRADAAKVFEAVHAADGIVLRSSIRDGGAGQAAAYFELLIPSGKVGDALSSFSAIAEVRSRHESTQDITAPTVGVGERLQDSRARVESLLGELADATTGEQRAAVEARLRAERRTASALRSQLAALRRRANFSRVSLRIETGEPSSQGGGAGWGIDDGLHDAGRILAVAAGVTVVGLAILAPFAVLFLLGWLGRRAWLRRARAQALART